MKKSIVVKLMLLAVLVLMAAVSIHSMLFNPTPVYSAINLQWGDSYSNGKGQTICVCDDKTKSCLPCLDIDPNQ
jgi:hypothetical protein